MNSPITATLVDRLLDVLDGLVSGTYESKMTRSDKLKQLSLWDEVRSELLDVASELRLEESDNEPVDCASDNEEDVG